MPTKEEIDIVRVGLAQIPLAGLRRLQKYIKDGEPLLLNGEVVGPRGAC